MANIKVVTHDQARLVSGRQTPGCETHAYIAGGGDPLHLREHRLAPGARLSIVGASADGLGYVMAGDVTLGDQTLEAGSSFVVEQHAATTLSAGVAGAIVAEFHDTARAAATGAKRGGRVHAMPHGTVPRTRNLGTASELSGAIHADATCPTCISGCTRTTSTRP